MTRGLAFLLSLILALSTAACSESSGPGDTEENTSANTGTNDGTTDEAIDETIDGTSDETDETDETDMTGWTLRTTLSADSVAAGGTLTVTCDVLSPDGVENNATLEGVATTVMVKADGSDATAVTIHDMTLTPTLVGAYTVHCDASEIDMQDATGANLTVTAGAAATTTATIDPTSITAGEASVVSCAVADAYGNAIEDAEPTIAIDSETASITGLNVTVTEAGAFMVTCDLDGADATGAELTVSPGAADAFTLAVTPEKPHYAIGAHVTFEAMLVDTHGNAIDTEVVMDVSEGTEWLEEMKYKFIAEGSHDFTASVADTTFAETLTLICDGGAPELVITSPDRGSTLDGTSDIAITGYATDAGTGVSSVTVNSEDMSLAEDGTFASSMEPVHGMNMVHAEAMDGASSITRTSHAYYHSTQWNGFGTEDPEESTIHDSVLAFLGQDFIDDGDRETIDDLATLAELGIAGMDLSTFSPTLSEISQPIIALPLDPVDGLDLSVNGTATFTASVVSVEMGDPALSMDTYEGGINVDVAISGEPAIKVVIGLDLILPITLDWTVTGAVCTALQLADCGLGSCPEACTGSEPGNTIASNLTADVSATLLGAAANIDISKLSGEELLIAIGTLTPSVEGIDINPVGTWTVDLGELDLGAVTQELNGGPLQLGSANLGDLLGDLNTFLSDNFLDPVTQALIDTTGDTLLPLYESFVGPTFETALNSLGTTSEITVVEGVEADEDAGIDAVPPVIMTMNVALDTVTFSEEGGAITLQTHVDAEKGIDRDPLGSILRGDCNGTVEGTYEFKKDKAIEFGFKLDMINQMLAGMWWTGGLNMSTDAQEEVDEDAMSEEPPPTPVDMIMHLPPIMDDCGAKGTFKVQVGDLEILSTFDLLGQNITLHAFVSFEADVALGTNSAGTELNATLGEIGTLAFDVVSIEAEDPSSYDPTSFEELVVSTALPMVMDEIVGQTLGSFPIPKISIGGIVPDVPADAELTPTSFEVVHEHGVVGIAGNLEDL